MVMIASLHVDVIYAQIVISEMPFRDIQWTDQHTAQGFAWSPGGVSFGVPGDAGASRLDVFRATAFTLDPWCLWAVQVPFEVKSGDIMVGSVVDPEPVHVERGRYELIFLALPGQDDASSVFQAHFIESLAPTYAILKRGTELQTDRVLRRDAEIYN